MKKYAIWNNKGGVGKTFLSFILSTEVALKNKDKKVLVVDMCPQANLSEIFLGGNSRGAGVLSKFIDEKNTIGGYITSRIASPHKITGDETSFITNVSKHHNKIPDNLFLIVGDPKLEIQAQVMSQISSQTLPPDSWKKVHSWLIDLVNAGLNKYSFDICFIDCNPSFSAYTEISLLAATNLIVPCSSDESSARAINNLATLIYGYNQSEDLKEASFSSKAERFSMELPCIHSVLLNRSTQYREKASKAFSAMFDEIKKRTNTFKEKEGRHFCSGFDYHDIPDAHTSAVVVSHLGIPISQLRDGPHNISDKTVQVNKEPIKRYQDAINKFVEKL